jgi:hypoxanthine-DNA glycosylase
MSICKGLKPIIDRNSTTLILGTMPSTESLGRGEYYGNPRNHFWIIIYSIFNATLETSYEAKLSFIRGKRIALWDVIGSCDRIGSSDSKITNICINDFDSLLTSYPKIKYIFFNGQKAFHTFRKEVDLDPSFGVTHRTLPSSSPANAKMSLNTKIQEWAIIQNK